MDVPKGAAMKPPRVLFIPLWRLLIFGRIKTSVGFQFCPSLRVYYQG
jgi:hypothetical protein